MLKIVTIGGGNGQSITLRALKNFSDQIEITSIVSVTDSGGSSGKLKKQFQILPMGDMLRVTLALSSYSFAELKEIFYTNRFTTGEFQGHNIGNLLLTFLYQQSGNWLKTLSVLSEVLKTKGKVLPVSLDLVELCAKLENGQTVVGETNIDIPKFDCRLKKEKMWLDPVAQILPEAKEAILQANYIILGPGDLYTSVIPGLLTVGMSEALLQTKAKIIFIPNLANRTKGETCGFKVSGYLQELHQYLPRPVDLIIAQDVKFKLSLDNFAAKDWEVVQIDEGSWQKQYQVVYADLCVGQKAGMDCQKLAIPLRKILGL